MPKVVPGTKHRAGLASKSTATARTPAGAMATATDFRSPVGCTSDTPGEQEFLAWCQEERVRFPSSRLAMLATTGRALVATRAIKMGEVVVEVPDDAVLMADNCSIREVLDEEGMCKPADDEILEVQGLIIGVMYEKSQGDKTRWAPYLRLLPDDMTHMPLYWKRREFRELRGTAAYDKMMGKVQHPADAPTQVPVLWSEVVEPFISEHPELGMPNGEQGYNLYRWATCAVASYSFLLGDDKYQAMVPVWDLLNHITGEVNVRLHHCAKRHVLQMLATRDINEGEELVNNYGELSNAELLRGYGFVEQRNRNNHVQVPLSFVLRAVRDVLEAEAGGPEAGPSSAAGPGPGSGVEEDEDSPLRRVLAARLRLGQRCGLLPQHHVFKVFAGRPPPATMTTLVYTLLASNDEAAVVRSAGRRAAESSGDKARKGTADGKKADQAAQQGPTEAAMEVAAAALTKTQASSRVQQVYEHVVQRMLGRYGGSLEDDEMLLARYAALPARHRAALLARKPEKEALVSLREVVRRKGALQRSLADAPGAMVPPPTRVGEKRGGANGVKKAGRGNVGPSEAVGGGKEDVSSAANKQFSFGFSL